MFGGMAAQPAHALPDGAAHPVINRLTVTIGYFGWKSPFPPLVGTHLLRSLRQGCSASPGTLTRWTRPAAFHLLEDHRAFAQNALAALGPTWVQTSSHLASGSAQRLPLTNLPLVGVSTLVVLYHAAGSGGEYQSPCSQKERLISGCWKSGATQVYFAGCCNILIITTQRGWLLTGTEMDVFRTARTPDTQELHQTRGAHEDGIARLP